MASGSPAVNAASSTPLTITSGVDARRLRSSARRAGDADARMNRIVTSRATC